MKPLLARGVLSVAAGALVVAAVVWARAGARDAAPPLATAAVVRGEVEDTVSALGSIQPLEFVDVGTQVSGQLKQLFVNIGDNVDKGAVIAEIDTAVLAARVEAGQATLASLSAQIDEKRAQLALATRQQQRNASLYAQDAVSRDALEASQAAARVSAAQVAALKAQRAQTGAALRIDQANLGYAKVHAPMAGTVVALAARQGQTLNASQQAPVLLRLARLDRMTVVTQVSEADVGRIETGTEVYFNTLGRPERRWSGRVRQILPTPETVNNVVLYSVLFDVDNADCALMTQMSAQVFFVLAQAKDVLTIPVAALGARVPARTRGAAPPDGTPAQDGAEPAPAVDKGKATRAAKLAAKAAVANTKTYRVDVLKDGKVEPRSVVVGVANRSTAQVLSGLAEGEQVVLAAAAEPARDTKSKDGARRTVRP